MNNRRKNASMTVAKQAASEAVRNAHSREKMRFSIPKVVMPLITDSVKLNLTVGIQLKFDQTHTHVEVKPAAVADSIRSILGMTSTWQDNLNFRIDDVLVYYPTVSASAINNTSGFHLTAYELGDASASILGRREAQGSLTEPARLKYRWPEVQQRQWISPLLDSPIIRISANGLPADVVTYMKVFFHLVVVYYPTLPASEVGNGWITLG